MAKQPKEESGPLDGLGSLLNDLHSTVKEGVQHVELAFSSLLPPLGRPLSIVREDESPSTDPRGDLAQRFPQFDPTARPGTRFEAAAPHPLVRDAGSSVSTPRTEGSRSRRGSRAGSKAGSVRSTSSAGSSRSRGSDDGFRVQTPKEQFEAMVMASRSQEVQEARLARSCQAIADVRSSNAAKAKPAVHVREVGKARRIKEYVPTVASNGKTLHDAMCRCPQCKELLSVRVQKQMSNEVEKALTQQDLAGVGAVRWR